MKKLLFVTALLAMGTMAMGATPNLSAKDDAKAEVKVRAEIVNDKFKITDIYGQPLILDFHEVMQDANTDVSTSVRYKVTTKAPFDGETAKFTMAIVGDNTANGVGKKVTIKHVNPAKTGKNSTLPVTLGLDNETKYLLKGESEFQGIISGNIHADTTSKELGEYIGYATLTATVGEVKGTAPDLP